MGGTRSNSKARAETKSGGRCTEGEKGLARAGGDSGGGNPAPEGEGATGDAAIEQARTASGEGRLIEGEELVRRDHCRGGALRVWVASQVTRVQVHEGEEGVVLHVIVTVRFLTKALFTGKKCWRAFRLLRILLPCCRSLRPTDVPFRMVAVNAQEKRFGKRRLRTPDSWHDAT